MTKQPAVKKEPWMLNEPEFNVMDYSFSLTRNLNYYNTELENDKKREMTIQYWRDQDREVVFFDKIASGYFSQLGALVRIKTRGYSLEDKHDAYIEKKYREFLHMSNQYKKELQQKPKEEVKRVVRKSLEEKMMDQVHEIGADIDGELDHIATTDKRLLNVKNQVVKNDVLPGTGKILAKMYQPQLDEFKKAILGLDSELKEGYKNFSKKTMRLMYDFLDEVVSACKQAKNMAKPKKKREKPASVIASKVKYMKDYAELQMKSISPEKIIGAETVYLFNTKLRKLFRYVAVEEKTLTIKGTSLQNFDTTKSSAKTIRKPEQFFQGINDMTKRPLNKKFDDVKSIGASAPGRINEDMIILKCF